MKHYLQKQAARIRVLCILFALLPLFAQKASAWSELQVKGAVGSGTWSTIATLTQGSDANTWLGTIDASSWTSGAQLSFKLYDGKDDNTTYWWGNSGTADMTSSSSVNLPGATTSGNNMTLKHSTNYSSYTLNCTYSGNSWTITITGVKGSSGGGSSTAGDESADDKDEESTKAGYGVPDKFGGVILRYNSSTAPTKGNLFDWKDYFSVAYLTPDSKKYKSNFAPYFIYLIKDVASHKEVEDGWNGYVVSMSQSTHPLSISAYGNPKFLIGNWSNSTSWTVGSELDYTSPYLKKIDTSHAGMLDFPLRTFMYNIVKGSYSDASARGWQALTNLTQIAPNNNYRSSVIGSGRNSDALYNRLGVTFVNNDKVNDITGVENIKKAYAVILTSPGTPVVNYSDLTNSDLNDNILRLIKIRQWAGIKNTSEFLNKESREKNHAYVYHIQGDFAELKVVIGDEAYLANYEKGGDGDQTSGGTKDRNSTEWGGESYSYTLLDEGTGWRVWYKNNNNANAIHVALSPESGYKTGTVTCTGQVIGIAGKGARYFYFTTDGTAPVIGASNSTLATYTWDDKTHSYEIGQFSANHETVVANGGYVTVIAQAYQDGALVGAIDTVTYRFSDYVPLTAKIDPATATVNYGEYLTPNVTIEDSPLTTGEKHYIYTVDGTTPTISSDGKVSGTTKLVSYTPDGVINNSTLGTFHRNGTEVVFIAPDGTSQTISNKSTITVKVFAVNKITSDGTTTYRIEGKAEGFYTFKPSGTFTDDLKYNISIASGTVDINTVSRAVKVFKGYEVDADADCFYQVVANKTTYPVQPVRGRTVSFTNGEYPHAGTIKVWLAADPTVKAETTYDITNSTSEGGYKNYLNNDQTALRYGGTEHVVVYVKSTDAANTYLFAYENVGSTAPYTAKMLTADGKGTLITSKKSVTIDGDTWYVFDIVPTSGYHEINAQINTTSATNYGTVANIYNDCFLDFDAKNNIIKDVTPSYTKGLFYTLTSGSTTGTKTEQANPTSSNPFFYVQVPDTWASGENNSLQITTSDGTAVTGLTLVKQPKAETSYRSVVYKVTGTPSVSEGTAIKFTPTNGTTASTNESFSAAYYNGGYYYYESASVNGLGLVFGEVPSTQSDKRITGLVDVNKVPVGDKTFYLANSWTYSPELASGTSETTSINDNWTGSEATVYVIPDETTISQTVTGLEPGTPYTVQMIVRGKSGAKGTMTLVGATTTTDELNLTGYDAQGIITADGRVEYLLNNDATKNGWQKLEASVKPATDGTVTVKLAANGEEMQLSDVTLLENANTTGHVWTTAPTSNDKTDYDLSDRATANAFSFFDRGDNKNAIVYANANTVLGMSENTYDVAVASTSGRTTTYVMKKLALTDQAQDGTTASGDEDKFYASGWSYGTSKAITTNSVYFDRSFKAGVKAAVCFPFSLTQNELETMFGSGAKAYNITAVDAAKLTVTSEESTNGITANTPCLIEPGTAYTASKEVTGSFTIDATPSYLSKSAGTGYTFEASYAYTWLWFNDKEHCYSFDPTLNGRFKYVSKSKGADCKPFRAYIKESNTSAKAKVFKLVISNTTTNIDDVKFEGTSQAPIYSISGALVSASGKKEGLPNGVYLQNGKKFIVNK